MSGMGIARVFTSKFKGLYAYQDIEKEVVDGIEYPKSLNQSGRYIMSKNYLRPYKVNGELKYEKSIFDIYSRLARGWAYWGKKKGYFKTKEVMEDFESEIRYTLAHMYWAPNSPQFFNCGFAEYYQDKGQEIPENNRYGYYYEDNKIKTTLTSKERGQLHACFIRSIEDSMNGDHSIYETIVREAIIFKDGSGIGQNYSKLRERGGALSEGGESSGLLSFLKLMAYSASRVKSGGVTRRAAKMGIINDDHPDIIEIIDFKKKEDDKVVDLALGNTLLLSIYDAYVTNLDLMYKINDLGFIEQKADYEKQRNTIISSLVDDTQTKSLINKYYGGSVCKPEDISNTDITSDTMTITRKLYKTIDTYLLSLAINEPDIVADKLRNLDNYSKLLIDTYGIDMMTTDMMGEAYNTVIGDSINISIGIHHETMRKYKEFLDSDKVDGSTNPDYDIDLISRSPVSTPNKKLNVGELFDHITKSALSCGDPGLMFVDRFEEFNTCANDGTIHATNPCGEYVFLDDTACNLASINLIKFLKPDGNLDNSDIHEVFDIDKYKLVINLCALVLDISIDMAKYPDPDIAKNSVLYRPLGLGYMNLGALLTTLNLSYSIDDKDPYNDKTYRTIMELSSTMTTAILEYSATMGKQLGAFERYEYNKIPYAKVLKRYVKDFLAVYGKKPVSSTLGLPPIALSIVAKLNSLIENIENDCARMRNAHVTCIAPTGTISFAMNVLTSGIEPDYSLRCQKVTVEKAKLISAGNGLTLKEFESMYPPSSKFDSLLECIMFDGNTLVDEVDTDKLERTVEFWVNFIKENTDYTLLPFGTVLKDQYNYALKKYYNFDRIDILNLTAIVFYEGGVPSHKNISSKYSENPSFDKFTSETISKIVHLMNVVVSTNPDQELSYKSHILATSAAMKILSGSISKTINLNSDAALEDIKDAYMMAYNYGLKGITVYKDGSKLSQPLSNIGETVDDYDTIDETKAKKCSGVCSCGKKDVSKEKKFVFENSVRKSFTFEYEVQGFKLYYTVSVDDKFIPREIFLTSNTFGSSESGFLNVLAIAISNMLRVGVSLSTIIKTYRNNNFVPNGLVISKDKYIRSCSSIVDLVVRVLDVYFNGNRYASAQGYPEYTVDGILVDLVSMFGNSTVDYIEDNNSEDEVRTKKSTNKNDKLNEKCTYCGTLGQIIVQGDNSCQKICEACGQPQAFKCG